MVRDPTVSSARRCTANRASIASTEATSSRSPPAFTRPSRSPSASDTTPGSTSEGNGIPSCRTPRSSTGTPSPSTIRCRTSTEVTARRRSSMAETSGCARPTSAPTRLWLLRVNLRHVFNRPPQSSAAAAARSSGCTHTSSSGSILEI